MKRLFWICVVVMVLIVAVGFLVEDPHEDEHKKAAIIAVKQNYQPSLRLSALHPDFKNASWSALPLSKDMCPYDDCYEVILETYLTEDSDERPLEATWYVALKEQKYQATNKEARIYFELKTPPQ